MGQEDVETRSTTAAEVKSGINLKPGHKTIVIIGDGKGTPLPVDPPRDDPPKDQPKKHTWSTEDNPPDAEDEPKKPDEPPKSEDKPKDEPKKPEPPKNQDKPKEEPKKPEPPKATPSVKGSFGAAHFETDKTLPLPASLPTFKGIAALANKE